MARRPSRTPIGLGRSAPRFGGSGPCIVEVEQQFHFDAFLTSRLTIRYVYLDYNIISVVTSLADEFW
jgi:hypothetical protein